MISASVSETIQFYHLDPMNVVWHGNYVQFFENARCALLDQIDYNYHQMDFLCLQKGEFINYTVMA